MRDPSTLLDLAAQRSEVVDKGRLLTLWWPAACGLVAAVVTFLLILPAGLWNDDLVNLQQHLDRSLGDLLLEPVFFTQVAPGHRLLTELQLQVGPSDRIVLHALVAVLAGACVIVGARVVATLGRPSWWVPFLLATTLIGPAGLSTNLWYAAWFHVMSSLLAGLVAILLYARWRGSAPDQLPPGRPTGAVIAIAVGTLFSVKVLLAVLLLVLVEYLLVRRGDLETLVVGLWRDRRVWAPFLLLAFFYWFYTARAGLDPVLGDLATTIEATWRGVAFLSVPMLVGLSPADVGYLEDPTPALIAAAWLAAAALGVAVLRRGDLARRGLGIGIVVLAVGVGMSAWVRTPGFGDLAALTPRYHLDGLSYLVLATGLGVLRTSRDTTPGLARSRVVRWAGRALPVVAAAALVVAVGWSDVARLDTSPVVRSGRWLDVVAASIEDIGPNPQILDAPLPFHIVSSFPGRRTADLDGLIPKFEVSVTAPDSVVTPAGQVEPLDARPFFRETGAEYAANGLVSVGQDAVVTGDAVCTGSWMTLDLVLGPHPHPRLIELTLGGASIARIDYVPRHGEIAEPASEVVTGPGTTSVVLPMDLLGWVERVDLDVRTVEDEDQACLTGVRFLEVFNELPGEDDLPA